jgi:site-specific recombinase XerD
LLREHPDSLIRSEDFPKLPDYLPRPLAPDVDRALQDFLLNQKQNARYARGLWLMRKAGLRIGELESLELDCLRKDHHGNAFLKVPLGKLNNERLVPLSPDAAKIATQLQQREPASRKYLLSDTLTLKPKRKVFVAMLAKASQTLNLQVPILSHQLRHTCATELINSGMSLVSLMGFLGHKDYRMTLRYAKITQQTITSEFHQALQHAEQRYHDALGECPSVIDDGPSLLSHLLKWCYRYPSSKDANRLIRRLHRLKPTIEKLRKQEKSTHRGT